MNPKVSSSLVPQAFHRVARTVLAGFAEPRANLLIGARAVEGALERKLRVSTGRHEVHATAGGAEKDKRVHEDAQGHPRISVS